MMSHSCSSVASCPHFLPFASCFGLHLSFWWESEARLCLWGLASLVCHGVLEQLRRDPSLGTPGAGLQLWQWAVTVRPEMHVLALGNRLFGQHGEGTKPWICERPSWLRKVLEKHLSGSLPYSEPTCCKRLLQRCSGA